MTETIFLQCEAGQVQVYEDRPEQIKGIALVTHPHPLMGGNPKHKIPQLMSEVFLANDCLVWRPSFRGADDSHGTHNDGVGESKDIANLAVQMQEKYPNLPFYAAGFSFGSHVWAKSFHLLDPAQRPKQLILAGLPAGRVRDLIDYKTPEIDHDILLVHGEQDEITPLADVVAWAKPQRHPITIMPGANHFFTGYLKPLKVVFERYLKF